MPAYHQMGHDTANLLADQQLRMFRGAIASPVNYTPEKMLKLVVALREGIELVFDPQLYYPLYQRGQLTSWDYYPADVDTADLADAAWWTRINEDVVRASLSMECESACSPARIPATFVDEYYDHVVETGEHFGRVAESAGVRPRLTVMVSLSEMALPLRPMEVASIVSRSSCNGIYLILVTDIDPRRELSDERSLAGVMRLVAALEGAAIDVLVAYCAADALLFKLAGATSCATGKFFNLRRFTRNRFADPPEGGRNVAYWFEESLLGFIRETDLIRVRAAGLESSTSLNNPFRAEISEAIAEGRPWVGFGWKQYMAWFGQAMERIESGGLDVQVTLARAEQTWLTMEDQNVLAEEPRNDGRWLRRWRRAAAEWDAPQN